MNARFDFIAEDAAAVDSHIGTYDQNGALSGIDDRSLIAILVKAVQELSAKVENAGSIAGTAATHALDTVLATHIVVTNLDAVDIHAQELHADKLCAGNTCITEQQLKTLIEQTAARSTDSNAPPPEPAPSADANTDATSSTTTTPDMNNSDNSSSAGQVENVPTQNTADMGASSTPISDALASTSPANP